MKKCMPCPKQVVCIDYFSERYEAKTLKDKKTTTVSQFLYELICRCCCLSIQINDQSRAFIKSVSPELRRLTRTIQCVTSARRPEENGRVERQSKKN